MEQIEKIFYDWTDDQTDSCELRTMYVKLEDELTKQIGKEKYSKFEDLIMDCILCERLEAFKGGFKQATSLWKLWLPVAVMIQFEDQIIDVSCLCPF